MQNKNLFDMIAVRKSIRKYDMRPLDADKLKEIRSFIDKIKPLDAGIKTEFSIIGLEAANGGLFAIKAPHYMVVCSETKGDYLMNAGFMMQQVDLFLAQSGIGACWLGMTKPNKEFILEQGMEFIIVLAFGLPTEPLYRSSLPEFKRRSLAELTDIKDVTGDPDLLSILEAARLAPSATNSQPWYFSGTPGAIVVSRARLNPLKLLIYNRMNQIDIGICLCHIWISATKIGKMTTFIRETGESAKALKGYEYIMTVKIHDDSQNNEG